MSHKIKQLTIATFAFIALLSFHSYAQTHMNMSKNTTPLFPKGEKAPASYFTGTAWIKPLVPNDATFNTVVSNVVFEPGARNHWHTHPAGQILIITDGIGYYQEKGKPIQLLHKGDVITVAPDVMHWHGASPQSELTHIAININTQKGVVVWLEKVTDEEYNSFAPAPAKKQ